MQNVNVQPSKHTDLETLSGRILHALASLNISQAELARKIHTSPQAINFLCKNNSLKSKLTYEIADALEINGTWLATGEGSMLQDKSSPSDFTNAQKRVPLVTIEKIKTTFKENKKTAVYDFSSSEQYCLTMSECGESGYALIHSDKSMSPRFEPGTLLIFNQKSQPKDKAFVLVYLESLDELVFRQLEIQETTSVLKPLNSAMYKNVTMSENDKIIGILSEARWQPSDI